MVVAAWLATRSSSSYTMMIFPAAFFCSVQVKVRENRNNLDKLLRPGLAEDGQGYIFQHFFAVGVHCPRQQCDGETVSCGRGRGGEQGMQ